MWLHGNVKSGRVIMGTITGLGGRKCVGAKCVGANQTF